MLTRSDIQRHLLPGLQTIFQKAYTDIPVVFPEVTLEVASNKDQETYAWLGGVPQLKKWVGERSAKALLEHGFVIRNEKYEASISVDADALDDDQYGQINIRVQQLASMARKGIDRFFVSTVEAGHTTVCYDGQNFFDTDHSEGTSGTQSNYSASGLAFSGTNLQTIITAMMQYKDDTGQVLGINPTHVMVPPALRFTALELLDPTFVGVTTDPAKATLKGALKVVVNPYLTNNGANSAYYVLDLSQAVKPFIFQNRLPIQFKESKDDEFMRDELKYGVKTRFAFGYGDWRLAYKAQG